MRVAAHSPHAPRASRKRRAAAVNAPPAGSRARRVPRSARAAASPFTVIPTIGPATAADLHSLGIDTWPALAKSDPEELFRRALARSADARPRLCRCVLYTYRLAVYYARVSLAGDDALPDRGLLAWSAWSDDNLRKAGRDASALLAAALDGCEGVRK